MTISQHMHLITGQGGAPYRHFCDLAIKKPVSSSLLSAQSGGSAVDGDIDRTGIVLLDPVGIEFCLSGIDPGILDGYWDADGDGFLNYQEYWSGTDPLHKDTDQDGASDAEEILTSHLVDGGKFHNAAIRDGAWVRVREFVANPDVDVTFTNIVEVSANVKHGLTLDASGHVWEWRYRSSSYAAWDINYGPSLVSNLEGVVSVAAGYQHNLALKSDGSIWVWGYSAYGENGRLGVFNEEVPAKVPGISNVVAIAAGYRFSMALTVDGHVWTWGYNHVGQLGNGYTDLGSHPVPESIVGLTNVVSISTKMEHSAAIDLHGQLWIWGGNADYKLGLGEGGVNAYPSPQAVPGMKRVKGVVCAISSTLVLGWDGKVWSWGSGWQGQTGIGPTGDGHKPVQIQRLEDVVMISAGARHSLALKADGSVWAWGWNKYGQIGNNSTNDVYAPVRIEGLRHVVTVVALNFNSMALHHDGTISMWGDNTYGQLGIGELSIERSLVPVGVPAMWLSDVVYIDASYQNPMALTATGELWMWGAGGNGQLGDNYWENAFLPVQVMAVAPDMGMMLGGGGWHNLLMRSDGSVYSWGCNHYDQLGYESRFNTHRQPVRRIFNVDEL